MNEKKQTLLKTVVLAFLPIVFTSCTQSLIAIHSLNRTDWGRALLAELLPSIAAAAAYYASLFYMANLENNKELKERVQFFVGVLLGCEVLGCFLPAVLLVLLALAQLAAMVIVPHRFFNLSLGKSFGALGISSLVAVLAGLIMEGV